MKDANGPLCPQTPTLHKLEMKCTILEHEFINVRETVVDMSGKVDHIQDYILKQNGVLPRLEKNMVDIINKLQDVETKTASSSTARQIIWPIVTGTILLIAGLLVGKFL